MSSGLLAIFTKRIAPRQRGQVMMSTANTLDSLGDPLELGRLAVERQAYLRRLSGHQHWTWHNLGPRLGVGREHAVIALLGEGRTRDVATQTRTALAVAAGHGRARVHVDATNFGERVVGLGDFSHRVRELASLLTRCVAKQLSVRGRGPIARREDRLLLPE